MNDIKESNPLYMSWCDSQWLPVLNSQNVLEYFGERSNPFYDRTCNNEILKMQRLPLDQLNKFQGIEYIVLHCQEPILYVIRKQERVNPNQATPIADYYIIAGVVYQAPDLYSLINSRILTTVHHLLSALDESYSYSRYHPSKGYWFEFNKDTDKDNKDKCDKTSKEKTKEEMSSSTKFQRKRVDILLSELTKRFPPKLIQATGQHSTQSTQQPSTQSNEKSNTSSAAIESEMKTENKTEKQDTSNTSQTGPVSNLVNSGSFRSSGGPPEKKQRLN